MLKLSAERSTPASTASGSRELLKPKALARWLEWLPQLNPSVSVSEILTAIGTLNEGQIPDKARQDLLDIYRLHVNRLVQAFDSAAFQRALRSADDGDQIARQVGGLSSELARNYKLIVLHTHEKGAGRTRKPRYRRAIYCAMEQTIFGLVHAFRTYRPLPHGAHRNLHELYRLAEDQGILNEPVSLGSEPGPLVTIGSLYSQFLLLCVADPYHLGRREVLPLFRFLARYSAAARLCREEACSDPQARFVVDLGGDGPPVPCSRLRDRESLKDPVILDTSEALSAAIRERPDPAAVAPKDRAVAQQWHRMLSHLIPHLQGMQMRKDPRQPVQRTVTVAIGLEAAHRLLGEEGHRLIQTAAQTGNLTIPVAGPHTQSALVLSTWRVADQGPGGLRLQGSRLALGDSQTGDLVSLLETDAVEHAGHVKLAVIRWVRAEDEGQLALGIERIRAPAAPVDGLALDRRGESGEPVPCLLLSGTGDGSEPATLLTPKGLYAEGELLSVTRADKTVHVRMGTRIMETACLDRFRFEQAKPTQT